VIPFIEELDYPILLSTTHQPERRGYFSNPPPKWWPWYEKLFVGNMRREIARVAGTAFVNNRFRGREEEDGEITRASLEPYLPGKLLEGANLAANALFHSLNSWNGGSDDDDAKGLDVILAPSLFQKFRKVHQAIDDAGAVVEFSFETQSSKVTDIWISFGEENLVTSTLLPGKLLNRASPASFVQMVPATESKPARTILREITFEYISLASKDIEPSDMEAKRELMLSGQRVAATIEFVAEVGVSVRSKEQPSKVLFKDSETREFVMRLESSHFKDRFPSNGRWRIADVDNRLAEKRVKEEERAELDD
jgi:hypothetical protein